MSDTFNADLTLDSTTNVTISNAATFTNTTTLEMKSDGRVVFTDVDGNVVKSRQRDLLKLYTRLLKEQTSTADFLDKPSVA